MLTWKTTCTYRRDSPAFTYESSSELTPFPRPTGRKRTLMRAEIVGLIIESQRCAQCEWGRKRQEGQRMIEISYRLMKILQVPLLKIINEMKKASSDNTTNNPGHCYTCMSYEGQTPGEKLVEKLEAIGERVGLCIDCIRSGATVPIV